MALPLEAQVGIALSADPAPDPVTEEFGEGLL